MKEFADDVVKVAMESASVGWRSRVINRAVQIGGGKEFRKARRGPIGIPEIDEIITLPGDGPERDRAVEYLEECVQSGCGQQTSDQPFEGDAD